MTSNYSLRNDGSPMMRSKYEITLLNEADRGKFDCPMCERVMRYPVIFQDCGHRVCSACIADIMRVSPRCPIDQIKLENGRMYPDKVYQKDVEKLGVKCSQHTDGCRWNGQLINLQVHLEKCDFRTVACLNGCGLRMNRLHLQMHQASECPSRKEPCSLCGEAVPIDHSQHNAVCVQAKIACPENCGAEFIRKKLNDHQKLDCPNFKISCHFAGAGCDFKCLRGELNQHLRSDYGRHVDMVAKALEGCPKLLENAENIFVQRLYALKMKSERMALLYYNNMHWRISDFANLFRRSQRVSKPEVKSAVLSTSRQGYRVQIIASLFGDECDQGQYMSLYARILTGEYDDLLDWPFPFNISLTMLDQCRRPELRKNVSITFDRNMDAYKPALEKPVEGRENPIFGTTRFIRHSDLFLDGHYVVEDSVVIQIDIHE